jgi:hypothetical protein
LKEVPDREQPVTDARRAMDELIELSTKHDE